MKIIFQSEHYIGNEVIYSSEHLRTTHGVLFHADCIADFGMKHLKDKSVDLILCDLPYDQTNNSWDILIPLDILWQEYRRILKPNGAVVLTSKEPFTSMLVMSNMSMFKYKIIWVKSKATNFLNAKKQPLRKYEEVLIFSDEPHEDLLVFYNKQPSYNPQMTEGEPYNKGLRKDQLTGSYGDFKPVEVKSNGLRYPVDVVYFKTAEAEGPVIHSTQKPLGLWEYLMKTYSNEGDVVLDNCSGSAVSAIAAHNLNRQYICFEKSNEIYCKARTRILDHVQKNHI